MKKKIHKPSRTIILDPVSSHAQKTQKDYLIRYTLSKAIFEKFRLLSLLSNHFQTTKAFFWESSPNYRNEARKTWSLTRMFCLRVHNKES